MSGTTALILISIIFWIWIFYEAWRAPLMRENEDGSYSTIRPEKKLKDLFKNKIMKQFMLKYKKPIIITISITVLQLVFGFDPKFTIINIIWLFV
jgi:hypothetical protein